MVKNQKHMFLDSLLGTRLLDEAQHAAALDLCIIKNKNIAPILLGNGFVQEDVLAKRLADFMGVEVLQSALAPRELAFPEKLSEKYLRQVNALPLSVRDGRLKVAMVDPLDEEAKKMMAVATGLEIECCVVTKSQAAALFDALAAGPAEVRKSKVRLVNNDMSNDAPVIRAVERIIDRAVVARASDIHVETHDQKLILRYRIDGILQNQTAPGDVPSEAVLSRLKIIAGMDIAEKRLPQDGRTTVISGGQEIDLRVASVPTLRGESMTLRLLSVVEGPPDLTALGYSDANLAALRGLLANPYGLLLVTGPTGSGKTTTLYAALREKIDGKVKIVSIEDPVEYDVEGVTQIQVNADIGLTFASALRSVLRHDPDIILVGEIRDRETAEIAVQAALTGHLVLATLHTNSAAAAITRLLDMGIPHYLISAALRGVVAQRLVRKLTKDGFSGRLAVSEILRVTPEVQALLSSGAGAQDIHAQAQAQGMKSLHADGMEKASRGLTTPEEIHRILLDGGAA